VKKWRERWREEEGYRERDKSETQTANSQLVQYFCSTCLLHNVPGLTSKFKNYTPMRQIVVNQGSTGLELGFWFVVLES
jgi:hypothetical protein